MAFIKLLTKLGDLITSGKGVTVTVDNGKISIGGTITRDERIGGDIRLVVDGLVSDLTVHGSATVNGNVKGNVDAGGSVNSGKVGGDIDAGGSVLVT
jgi:hypothetical protein